MQLQFWFEFASTYSYPSAMRIETACGDRGIALAWRPFLLGPIFRAHGWNDSPFNLYPAKGRYMWRDLERVCAAQGIALRHPTVFPRNGLLPARIACLYAASPWLPEFVRRVYHANFALDHDIADQDVIATLLAGLVADPAAVIDAAASAAAKDALRAATAEAIRRGIFGAPSFVIVAGPLQGDELFWGNDRLEAALAWYEDAARAYQ